MDFGLCVNVHDTLNPRGEAVGTTLKLAIILLVAIDATTFGAITALSDVFSERVSIQGSSQAFGVLRRIQD